MKRISIYKSINTFINYYKVVGLDKLFNNTETVVLKRLSVITLITLFVVLDSFGATYFSRRSGDWTSNTTWATSSGTGSVAVGVYPGAGDIVYIERGYTVTVNSTSVACASITIGRVATIGGGNTRTGFLAFATSGSPSLTVSGNIQIGGSSNSNSAGTITFQNGSSLAAGSITLGNGTSNASGSIVMTNGGTLTMNGALALGGSGTKTFTSGTGTVVMNARNTLPTTVFNNFYNLTINSGTTNLSANITLYNNLTVSTNDTLNLSTFSANRNSAGGVLTVAGTLQLGNNTGGRGASNFPNLFNTNTLTGGTVEYNRAGDQTVYATTYNNLIISNSGTKSLAANTAIAGNLSINTDATLNLLTHTANRSSAGGTLTVSSNANLIVGGATNFPLNYSTVNLNATSTVNYNSGTQTISGQTYGNLTLSGGTKTLGAATNVNGTLTLRGNLLNIGNNDLTIGGTGSILGSFSNTNMINTSGNGTLRKVFTSATTFTFPIGENTATTEYSPFTVNFSSATFAPGALVAVKVTDQKHPSITGTSNFVSRYWTVSQTGITNMVATINGTFTAADISGYSISNIISSRYNSNNQEWTDHNVASAFGISATDITSFGDFTGRNNVPTIVTSTSSLTGFNYMFGYGPSAIQPFNVSGSGLTTNIELQPTDSFEISTLGGTSFTAMPLIRLNVRNREVSENAIYVRLKAGLAVKASIVNNLNITSTGATTARVSCSGSVTNKSTISLSPDTLSNFSYNFGGGPSPSQLVAVTGSYLTNIITVTAPTNYQIATSAGGTYGSSLTLTPSGGNVSTNLYVRLKSGLTAAIYNESFTFNSDNADTKILVCEGEVNRASLAVSKITLAGFIYSSGNGPSSVQTFTVSGSTLTNDVSLTPPTNFEISLNNSAFYSSALSITPVSGTVAPTTVYVRLRNSLPTQSYSNENIVIASTGAISQTVKCSGQVSASTATISSVNTLNGFFYLNGRGPSIVQSFTVSGTGLSSQIEVTSETPENFELSTDGNSFSASVSIEKNGTVVNAVPVYIRLKSGLAVGDYLNREITLSTTGASDVTVVVNGKVVTTPTLIAGPAGLDSICNNETVTLEASGTADNWLWTGPNNFSSTLQEPSLGTVTSTNNGNYIVSSNVLSGVSLITNGDFELGNQDFGSMYTFRDFGGTSNPYSVYWIMPSPSNANSAYFLNTTDHTPSPGTLQMIIDGSETNGAIIWSQTITVGKNSNYFFKYYGQNVNNTTDTNYGKLQLYVNNVATGNVNTLSVKGWTEFSTVLNSGNSTNLQLTLINTHTGGQGNDFAIDDISLEEILQVKDTVTLNVIPTLTPTVVVTASGNPVYSGTLVTFTANVSNAGLNPRYQWQLGGVDIPGATSATLDYTPTDGQQISCIVTSLYKCTSVNPVSSSVTMSVLNRTNYWYGGISTDWGTPGNWTQGFIPLAGNDVVFATADNNGGNAAQRNLVLDTDRTIGNLINDTYLAVKIPAGKSLIVNNNISMINKIDSMIQIKASASLPNGSLIYNNSPSNPVNATIEMYSRASWDLERPVNQKYNWQYFGIPVQTLNALPTFYGSYVRQMLEHKDKISNHWESLTNESVLVPFRGYELCQEAPRMYAFTGRLVNSSFNSGQLVKTLTGNPLYPGQHLLANPYTAGISIKDITFGNDIEKTVYIYNTGTYNSWNSESPTPDSLSFSTGQYIAAPQAVAGRSGIARQIPSMGTFLVRITSATSTSQCFVSLNYSSVIKPNTELQRMKQTDYANNEQGDDSQEPSSTVINLTGEFGSDKLWLFTHHKFSNDFDNGYDGYKMEGSALKPQLYAVSNGTKYQINSIPELDNSTLMFKAGQDSEYSLKIKHDAATLAKYSKIYLHDLIENVIVDISSENNEYHFTSNATPEAQVRFKIIASKTNDQQLNQNLTSVYAYNERLYIQNLSDQVGRIYLYNISGRLIAVKDIEGYENISLAVDKKTVYILKTVIANKTENNKIIIQ